MDKDKHDINDIDCFPIQIGGFTYNINRNLDKFCSLTDFSDASPKYDPENGPHLQVTDKNTGRTQIISLSDEVILRMNIPNGNEYTQQEYYQKFVEIKKNMVNSSLIHKTFAKGYENPTPIQSLSILEFIQGRDILVQSKSGTGKTHAFIFGSLWHFDPTDKNLQHIFVTSSHEVATQIYDHARFMMPEEIKISLCIGQKKDANGGTGGGFKPSIGTSSLTNKAKSIKEEREEVQSAQIIVGTMGKLYDYICNKKWLRLDSIKTFSVDEFDNIVFSRNRPRSSTSMSTQDQIDEIMKKIPHNTQRAFFSATINEEALQIACGHFRPYNIAVGERFIVLLDAEDYTLEGIRQYYVQCTNYECKRDVLLDLLKQCRISQGIIYVNKIETANDIKYFLDGLDVPIISAVFHGGLSAGERKSIHRSFTENKIRLLISTDVTARGLDVHGINVVINFDMPDVLETYIHRIGRSGRYGRKGIAISLILVNAKMNEVQKINAINECSKNSKIDALPEDLANLL
jgi:ATP-dependent RNA helicase